MSLCSIGVFLSATSLHAQALEVTVTKRNNHDFGNVTNAGLVSQPVTDDGVAVFRVRMRRHNTLQRTLDVNITVPTIAEVQSWNVAYTIGTDDPASSTPTTLTPTLSVESKATAGGNRVNYFFYVYTDVNFGSTSAAYVEDIVLNATYSEI